jgi:hypothetical protein
MAAPLQLTNEQVTGLVNTYNRYSSVASLYLSQLAKQEDNPIIAQMKKIDEDNVKNKQLLDSFNGDIDQAMAVQANSDQLAKDVTALGDIAAKSPELTLDQAIELGKVSQKMNDDVVAGLEALIAKKSVFDQIGVSSVVLAQLQAQNSGQDKTTDVVTSKLPAAAKAYQQNQPNLIVDTIKKAIAAYSVEAPDSN